jgi:DNA (cytosine-5)-methyltransferase 1
VVEESSTEKLGGSVGVIKHLDLFSGIGGFALAAQWVGAIETMQFVEIDPFCQKVLSKNFPGIPIHEDIRTFAARDCDLITAGFPCQDISIAGHGVGLDGERSGLFYEVIRIVRDCRPRYLVLENVAALISSNRGRDMATVLYELSAIGYDAEWEVIPASALGANHERERTWIVAYPNGDRRSRAKRKGREAIQKRRILQPNEDGEKLRQNHRSPELFATPRLSDLAEFPGVDDGVSAGMDGTRRPRIKALGNAVVPHVAMIPLKRILDIDSQSKMSGGAPAKHPATPDHG